MGAVQSTVISDTVSVCMHVCMSMHISKTMSNFRTLPYLWPRLSPPVTAVQCVMHFRFCD